MERYIQITIDDLKKIIIESIEKALIDHEKKKINIPMRSHLTFKEAAKYLCVAEQTLYQYVSNRDITHFKKDKKLYFLKEDLDNWIKQNRYLSRYEAWLSSKNSNI